MRFFLHIRDGDELIEDFEGVECRDLAMAHEEAVQEVREILAEKLKRGMILDGQTIEIHGQDGQLLETLKIKDVMRLF